uniref:Hypothetical chloroplast RF1 n=1 Tax=Selaginella kraussiana TaxID=81964 RepID=A0A3Q9R202_9TRAC|nr:hypothetical chloroplast RF1 [Selaginella kraussiana]AZU95779.1 hypothetical chloroplast RF1 [Selaginella kraussiana]
MQKRILLLRISRAPMTLVINVSSPLIPFGLYCGFALALPTGLHNLFLMVTEGSPINFGGVISGSTVIGSLVGQIVLILSVYYPRLYVALMKPHAITLLILPCILFHWRRLSLRLRSGEEIQFSATASPHIAMIRARGAAHSESTITFLGSAPVGVRRSILLDILHLSLFHYAFVLSPAPARLVNIIAYRYSNQFLFIVSSLCGWLGGSFSLGYLAEQVPASENKREGHGPTRQPGIRHLICRVPSILVMAFCLLYLGRAPLPLPSLRETHRKLQPDGSIQEFSWLEEWPTGIFDYSRGTRPFRYVTDCYESEGPVKKELFQHYFHSSGVDGKPKLYLAYPPSLSIFGNSLDGYLNIILPLHSAPRGNLFAERELASIGGLKEYYLNNELTDRLGSLVRWNSLARVADNENGLYARGRSAFAKIYDPYLSKELRGIISGLRTTWISTPTAALGRVPPDYLSGELPDYYPRNASTSRQNTRQRGGPPLNWGDVTTRNYHSSMVAESLRIQYDSNTSIESIWEQMPQCVSNLASDTVLGPLGTIRSMRVRNVSYVVNDRTGISRILKRPVPQPDYRRNLVIGSMRARRRKTLAWEPSQYRTDSTFSLRILESSDSLQYLPGMAESAEYFAARCPTEMGRLKYFAFSDHVGVTEANRIATAKGWDFSTAHWVRGLLLISQSYSRRNVVLPLLIAAKNICCLVALQTAEWREDWDELDKEIYVGCNYDGGEISTRGLPPHWHREGIQIKIVNPFRLKRRRQQDIVTGRLVSRNDGTRIGRLAGSTQNVSEVPYPPGGAESYGYSDPGEIGYGFLTVMGYQTELPFGNRKPGPNYPFWRLLLMDAGVRWKDNIKGIKQFIKNRLRGYIPELRTEHRREPLLHTGTGELDSTHIVSSYTEPIEVDHFETNSSTDSPSPSSTRAGRLYNSGVVYQRPQSGPEQGLTTDDKPTSTTNKAICCLRAQRIKVETYLSKAMPRSANRIILTCCPFSTRWLNVQLIKLFARLITKLAIYLPNARSHIAYLFFQKKDCTATGEFSPAQAQHHVGLVSGAYASYGAWQLVNIMNNDLSPDSQELGPIPGHGTIDKGRQSLGPIPGHGTFYPGQKPRGTKGSDWYSKSSSSSRRCETTPGKRIWWYRIAPWGWNTMDVWHPMTPGSCSLAADPRDNPKSMGIEEENGYASTVSDLADAAWLGKIAKRYESSLPAQNYLELASAGVPVFGGPWEGELTPPDARAPTGDRDGFVYRDGSGGRRSKDLTHAWDAAADSNLRLWLYTRAIKRFQTLEMPVLKAMLRTLESMTPDIMPSLGGRAPAGCQGSLYHWSERELWEDRINRWDLNEQVATVMIKIRDAANALRASSTVLSGSVYTQGLTSHQMEPLYEDASKSIALLLHYSQPNNTNGILEKSEHHLVEGAADWLMTRKMLSVLLSLRTRFKVILRLIPNAGSVLRCLATPGIAEELIYYSSYISDFLLPRRRAELRILESMMTLRGPADDDEWGTDAIGGGRDIARAGSDEPCREDTFPWEDTFIITRNTQLDTGSGTRTIRSILWPGCRLEDLSCMNRFQIDTNDGSRFATLRVCPYPLAGIFMGSNWGLWMLRAFRRLSAIRE